MLRPLRPYLVVLGVLWLLPAVLVVVLHLTLPDVNENGRCEGIGFGCVPTPADSALLFGVLASPWLLLAGLLGCVGVALVRWSRARGPAGDASPRVSSRRRASR